MRRRDLEPRNAPITRKPSLMGVSTARVEGGELVIETTRIAANWTNYLALHSDQLIVVERYPRSKDTEGSLPDRDLHRSSDAEGTRRVEEGVELGAQFQDRALQRLSAPDRTGQQRTVMVKAKTICVIVFGLTVITAGAATAHHAFSPVYDIKRTISLQGVVTEFRLVNPHALMLMDVTDESGKVS